MISLVDLTKNMENSLNNNAMGLTIKLFCDVGKFKKAIRRYNTVIDYVNGMVANTQSELTKTNDGLIVGTMTNRIELLFKCKDNEEDETRSVETENGIIEEIIEGNERYFENIRTWLDNFCQEQTFSVLTDLENNTFDVSVTYSLAVPGVRNQTPQLGESMTFVIYAYYTFVQNGENSINNKFFLDGNQIPYIVCTVRRVPNVEMDVYANTRDGSAKATVGNTVWGASLNCPSFISAFSNTLKNYLLNGERNVAHILEHVSDNMSKIYIVFLGEGSSTYQGVMNAGKDISFTEAVEDYELVSFPDNYIIYQVNDAQNCTIKASKPLYVISSVDMKPKKLGEISDGNYTIDLSLENGCYVVSTGELEITNSTKL